MTPIKIMPMTEFKLETFGVGSDGSANCTTAIIPLTQMFFNLLFCRFKRVITGEENLV